MRKNPQTSHVRVGVSISPTVPRTCPVTGPRGFAISGPVIWNSLSDTWSPRSVSVCCEFLTPTQLLKTVNRAWNHSIFVIVYYKRGRNINLLYPSHHTPWSWLKCLRDARCKSWVKPTATPSSLPGLGVWFRGVVCCVCVTVIRLRGSIVSDRWPAVQQPIAYRRRGLVRMRGAVYCHNAGLLLPTVGIGA